MAGRVITETEEKLNAYFDEIEAKRAEEVKAKSKERTKPTEAGVCRALDITSYEFRQIALAYNNDKATRATKLAELGIQPNYAKLIYDATLRIAECAQSGDTAGAIFTSKQPHLGGYTDKDAGNGNVAPAIHIHLGGMGKDEHPGK
jgi:hypothetical protein